MPGSHIRVCLRLVGKSSKLFHVIFTLAPDIVAQTLYASSDSVLDFKS